MAAEPTFSKYRITQAFNDLKPACGGVLEDYFGLLYLEQEYDLPRQKAANQVAFGGHDYGIDGFHFDEKRKCLYLFQFKYSNSYSQFKGSLKRLIDVGVDRIFVTPNKDDHKNPLLIQLRSCLLENRSVIEQVSFRFVFTGNPEDAERSSVLDKLREDLENKKYLIDKFFGHANTQFVVEFRSATGRVGSVRIARVASHFELELENVIEQNGPSNERMYVGFIKLKDILSMYNELGSRFFDSNIRYGLGDGEAVNRAINRTLRQIVLDGNESPSVFAFNHNGITLYAEKAERIDGHWTLSSPRLLNGAQTVTTAQNFRNSNRDNPKLQTGQERYDSIRVLCKVITAADQKFITKVTINNNRQNPVEPWNLHANDLIQLDLQDKFASELGIFYQRQENAFDQLSAEDLQEYGVTEDSKAIQMLKLTQTFLLTDGSISKLSKIREVFEEDKTYDSVFRPSRLNADSRHILICYKIQERLRKLSNEIEQRGQNKYWFISRARNLLWALLAQGLLNHKDLEDIAERYGKSLSLPIDYKSLLISIATTKVRPLLADLMKDPDYAEKVVQENLGFLRSDAAFEHCMDYASDKWGWTHKKLS